jgi:hypothetical protein
MSGGGNVGVFALARPDLTTPTFVYPQGKTFLAFGAGDEAFTISPSTNIVDRLVLTTTAATSAGGASSQTPAFIAGHAAGGNSLAFVSADGIGGGTAIDKVAFTGNPSVHCATAVKGRVAVDDTGVFVLRDVAEDAVVTRCPAPSAVAPAGPPVLAVPIEATRYNHVKGLALSPAPNACVYFSANQKGTSGSPYSLRAVPRPP